MRIANKPLEITLKNIGLNDKEAKVYLALLQLGPTDAKNISLKSGIKKPTTYVILDDLRQKDAVLFLPNSKKKLFAAKSPQDIFDMATKRMNQASMNLPLLNQLAKESKDKAMVTYYEGGAGYLKAMQYKEKEIIDEGELLAYFASDEKANPAMLPSIHAYIQRLKKQNVSIRAFASDNARMKNYREKDAEFNHDVKILPIDTYNALSSIEIGRTFVRFTLFEQEMFVIIDNPEITKIMRQIFEMNWKKY